MKINIKKAVSIAAAFVFCTNSIYYADAVCFSGSSSDISDIYEERIEKSSDAAVSYSEPSFTSVTGDVDSDIMTLEPVSEYKTITDDDIYETGEELPEKYDMRTEETATVVGNQGNYGACWTFAASSSAETSLNKYIPSINLSEWHTAFFTYYGDNQIDIGLTEPSEIVNNGGTVFAVANLWAQWIGAVSDDKMTYGNLDIFDDSEYISEMQSTSDYHLENAYMFDYNDDGSNRETVNSLVKQFVMNGNAVDVSFYTKSSETYNSITYSSYSDKSPAYANHSVVIEGWDDNYSAENFRADNRPSSDGAWICQNSWGTHYGSDGYFYISYEDASLCEFGVFDMGASDNYETNYQLDSFVPVQSMSADDNDEINQPSYMANIFTAESNQQIEAVSTYINHPGTEYEITVYTDLSDVSDPSSGTASEVTRGVSDLTGYITIELDNNVVVDEGKMFSVVVKLYSEESKYVLPLETCMVIENSDTGKVISLGSYTTYERICKYTGENESFYSEDGINWIDVTESNYEYSDDDKNKILESMIEENADILSDESIAAYRKLFSYGSLKVIMGNVSLKAFANPVGTVDFSHMSGNVPQNEAVTLSSKDDSIIYYSINGGEEKIYDEPIQITEEMTISATIDGENYTERSYKPEKAELTALGYYTSYQDMGGSDIAYAERIDESTYNIYVSGSESTIRIYPMSAADVTMNGKTLSDRTLSGAIKLDSLDNQIILELSQENMLDNTVTINVYREFFEFDLESETVKFDEEYAELYAPDGNMIMSGDSVAEYAGMTLETVTDGIEGTVQIPSRADISGLEINFSTETLGIIPEEDYERVEYAVKENPEDEDFILLGERCVDGYNESGMPVAGKEVKIIPGETITLRITSGNGMFASEPVTYEIPVAVNSPSEFPEYKCANGEFIFDETENIEYGVCVKSESRDELEQEALDFGYDSEDYIMLLSERYGVSSEEELLLVRGMEWSRSAYSEKDNNTVAVRYTAGEGKFASAVNVFSLDYVLLKGDANGDGVVDGVDSTRILMYYVAKSTNNDFDISAEELEAADYNSDGKADAVDSTSVLTYYTKRQVSNS